MREWQIGNARLGYEWLFAYRPESTPLMGIGLMRVRVEVEGLDWVLAGFDDMGNVFPSSLATTLPRR